MEVPTEKLSLLQSPKMNDMYDVSKQLGWHRLWESQNQKKNGIFSCVSTFKSGPNF